MGYVLCMLIVWPLFVCPSLGMESGLPETLRKKCDLKDPESCFALAYHYDLSGKNDDAFSVYKNACELKYLPACYNLGLYLIERKEKDKAREYFIKCCMGDHYKGCVNLGIWEQNYGKKNDAEGYFRMGCTGRVPLGCFYLGSFYERKKDKLNAHNAFLSGCVLGDLENCLKVAMYEMEEGKQKKAMDRFKDLCRKDLARGCRYYGFLLEKTGDLVQANKIYQKACHYLDAGSCWLYASRIKKSQFAVAKKYFDRSCKLNFESACHELEKMKKGHK